MYYLADSVGPLDTVWHLHTDNPLHANMLKPGSTLHVENEFVRVVKLIERTLIHDPQGVFYCIRIEVERGLRNRVSAQTAVISTAQLMTDAHPTVQQRRADDMVEVACFNTLEFVINRLVESPEYIKLLSSEGEIGVKSLRRSAFWNGIRKKLKSELGKIR